LLGCLPIFRIPLYYNTSRIFLHSGQHACIYNSTLLKTLIKDYYDNKIKEGFDTYLSLHSFTIPIYMYNICLCYQLFPNTENSKNWAMDIYGNTNIFNKRLTNLSKIYMSYFQLDKKIEPGYKVLYIVSLLLFYLIIMIISILCVYIFWNR
jgi:hypothetical protein